MNVFNRAIVALLALGWCALMGGLLLLVWDESRVVDVTNRAFQLQFDISITGQSERILATLVLGALMLVGLMLFAMQLVPHRRRDVARNDHRLDEMQKRVDGLQRQLDGERTHERRVSTRETPVTAGDHITEQESVVREDRRPRRWRFLPGR